MTHLNARSQEVRVETMSPSVSFKYQAMPPPVAQQTREIQFHRVVDLGCDLFIPTLSPASKDTEKFQFSLRPRPSLLPRPIPDDLSLMAMDETDDVDNFSNSQPLSIPPEVSMDDTFSISDDGSVGGLPDFPDLAEISSDDSDSELSSVDSFMASMPTSTHLRPRLPSKIDLGENCGGFFDV